MRVKPDPKVDAKTEAQIQKDMEEMTLDIAHFREIKFQSSRVEKAGGAVERRRDVIAARCIEAGAGERRAGRRSLHGPRHDQADRFRHQAD